MADDQIAPVFAVTGSSLSRTFDRGMVQVTALGDDVIRVRVSQAASLPEDASWAVLEQARMSRVAIVPAPDGQVGFDTASLCVRIDPHSGAVTITDRRGRLVCADVAGIGPSFGEDGFMVRKRLAADERVFGLGDRAGPIDRRGGSFTLWNTDAYAFEEGTDPLYKAIPFLIGVDHGRAYGLLLDSTWRSHFDVGKACTDELRFGASGGPLDYYVLHGPTPKDVLRRYAWLTGPAPLPPLWAFGFQQCRYSYMSAGEVRAVAATFRRKRIPADVLWLDIDYQDRNRPFTVNGETFPDLPGLLDDLRRQQFRTVLIADMHVPVLPDAGYEPYESGRAGGHFLRDPDGGFHTDPVWPGPSHFPDFTRAETRDWWGGLYRDFCEAGAAGFWDDMNEPAVFDTPTHTLPLDVESRIAEPGFEPRTATQHEIHNVYGMLNARATHDGLLRLRPDRRPFVMTRAAFAGTQRYAVTWTGDNSSTWNHLRLSTPMLLSLGLSGMPFSGVDLGGFVGTPSAELLTRWLQLGMFNPISRDHTDKGTPSQEPWVHGSRHEALRRQAIEARYRLLPYIYTVAEEASRTGVPMMRPLFMEFPDAGGAWPLDHAAPAQFMWGPDLMVAPAPHGESPAPYPVLLPPGGWYDERTGLRVCGAKAAAISIEGRAAAVPGNGPGPGPGDSDSDEEVHDGLRLLLVTPKPDVLPVYARAGAIIPRHDVIQSTMETPSGPLQLHIYPGPTCVGTLYLDDGTSLAYRTGAFLRRCYRCERTGDGFTILQSDAQGSFAPWWSEVAIILHDVAASREDRDWSYDPATRAATITVTDAGLRAGVHRHR